MQIDYVDLLLTTQFPMQKVMSKVQKGMVVEQGGGRKFDNRNVKNGSGGKRGHWAKNNRLKDVDGCEAGFVGDSDEHIDDPLMEAMKRSM